VLVFKHFSFEWFEFLIDNYMIRAVIKVFEHLVHPLLFFRASRLYILLYALPTTPNISQEALSDCS